jgi:hypothetical protein
MTRSTPLARIALTLSLPLVAAVGCDPQPVEADDSGSLADDASDDASDGEAVPGAAELAEAEAILGEGSWSLAGPDCGPLASFTRLEIITEAGTDLRLVASDEALSCADYNAHERELENLQIVRALAADSGDLEGQCETVRDTLVREMWSEASVRPSGSCTLTLDPGGGSPPELELGSPARLGLMAAALDDCAALDDAGDLFEALAEAKAAADAALAPVVITFEGSREPSLKVGAAHTGVALDGSLAARSTASKPGLWVRGLAESCVVDLRD